MKNHLIVFDNLTEKQHFITQNLFFKYWKGDYRLLAAPFPLTFVLDRPQINNLLANLNLTIDSCINDIEPEKHEHLAECCYELIAKIKNDMNWRL